MGDCNEQKPLKEKQENTAKLQSGRRSYAGAVTEASAEEQENTAERRYFLVKCEKRCYNEIIKGSKNKGNR